ncbi:MAG: drug resistance transporter EmrB/QacA subfamily [Frankiales bacterium]|nr:drug resistance transporter EmrB/QacA subfamily [Frankiales bacterium]
MTAPPPAHAPVLARSGRPVHPTLVLLIVLSAVFMQLLDVSIVNVAVPSVQRDLDASYSSIQLVLAGYQLAFACVLITGARLGDIYGRRRLFMTGMAVFTVASLACGLAPSALTLVLARILQGLGSGLMFPQVLAVIQVTFAPRERGKAFGIFGATIGIATILGPLVGGLLIKADIFGSDWRAIFLVNIPVGLTALALAFRELPESTSPDRVRLDLLGAALVTTGLFLVVFPLTEGRERGWPAWIFLMLLAAVPVLTAFVLLQRRKTREDSGPLVLMTLFSNRAFWTGALVSAVFLLGVPPFFFSFSLYLQVGLGFTALHAGLTTFPFAVGSGLASSRSDAVAKRLGKNVLAVGCLLLVAGMIALIAELHLIGTDLHGWEVAPVLFVCGLGLGLFVAPISNIVLARVAGREAGSASGVLSSVQQIGGALGVALIGLILFGLLGGHAGSAAREASVDLRKDLAAAGLPAPAVQQAVARFEDCFDRQAHAKDPSRRPAGCETPPASPATAAFAKAGGRANADNFLHAIERTLLFEVGVFLLAFLLVRLLPPVDLGQRQQAQESAA